MHVFRCPLGCFLPHPHHACKFCGVMDKHRSADCPEKPDVPPRSAECPEIPHGPDPPEEPTGEAYVQQLEDQLRQARIQVNFLQQRLKDCEKELDDARRQLSAFVSLASLPSRLLELPQEKVLVRPPESIVKVSSSSGPTCTDQGKAASSSCSVSISSGTVCSGNPAVTVGQSGPPPVSVLTFCMIVFFYILAEEVPSVS